MIVKASSFADPADIKAFRSCKSQGHTDQYCFARGDNGIGVWGGDTTADYPLCALPRDDWKNYPNPEHAGVIVRANGRVITCLLADTMPWKKNIKNGAGIDLNPCACALLGLNPPILVAAQWVWAIPHPEAEGQGRKLIEIFHEEKL